MDIARDVKNQLCIEGHLNAALDEIMACREPDVVFNLLSSLAHKAVDMAVEAEREACAKPPDVLFDGYAVLQALDENARKRTSPENVSDVLDAVVRLMRSNVEVRGAAPERKDDE